MALRATCLSLAIFAAMPALADDDLPSEEAAAWTRHEVDLQYMGFTTRYTCSGMKSKVKLLLKHMGVRNDVKIIERGCEFGYQKVADFPRMKITFWAPTLPKQGEKDPGEPVLGVWKSVVIKRDSPKGLEMGDCELVDIFNNRVLPLFLTRNVQGGVNCIPHQLVGNRIDLRMEVLTGVQSVDDAKARDQKQSLH
jgi:hypothetical protein